MSATVEQIARVCHETNRGWCEANGDFSQRSWDDAEEWQRDSAIEGVSVALAGATPEQQHDAWCQSKFDDGWVYGDTKDADAKTHPCLVPYSDLPAEQKVKDHLFVAIVSTLGRTSLAEV
jgi:hypothetical protein